MGTSPPAENYRDRAKECFRLAEVENDPWTKDALQRFGCNMLEIAQDLETTTAITPPYFAPA
jgi:hypothetical protein